jgi:hypothetical protein
VLTVACQSDADAFEVCTEPHSSDCDMAVHPASPDADVSCDFECPGWSVSCQATSQAGAFACTCQAGTHKGAMFEAADCGEAALRLGQRTCE